jgi:hypothetical protein
MASLPDGTGWSLLARLEGRALVLARSGWIVLLACLVALVITGYIRGFRDPDLAALPALQAIFERYAIPSRLMMVLALILPLAVVYAVCLVVFWRRSHDPMALLFTATIAAMYSYTTRGVAIHLDHPLLWVATPVTFALGAVGLSILLALFPDGRCTPRWGRWLPGATLLLIVARPTIGRDLQWLVEDRPGVSPAVGWWMVGWGAVMGVGFLAQAWRYRHVATPTQRRQVLWVLVPLGASLIGIGTMLAAVAMAPDLADRWLGWALALLVPAGIAVPLALGNAVLRYRLYDLDTVLSRTVTYGVVVLCLAATYVASVVALGALVARVTPGGGGDLPVAASTLAAIALFRPLRNRVQGAVDRRFARTRYLAEREVEAFTSRLRDEVDVDAVVRQLRATATATVAPAATTVWLRGDHPAVAHRTRGGYRPSSV